MREVNKMESEELRYLADELTPFTKNYLHNMVTILDDSDAIRMGKYDEKTLSEKYLENLEHLRSAEPKHNYDAERQEPTGPGMIGDTMDESMSSNNWVIHGKHTATGKPMLASDPHLGTSLPSFWTLTELIWEENFLIGGTVPGIPLVGIGRSKNTSFGQTAALADSSDLWQETLNDDLTKYFVDGEWRDLKIVTETIKIKGQDDL